MPTFCGRQKLPTTCTSWARTRSSCETARSWPSHSPARLRPRPSGHSLRCKCRATRAPHSSHPVVAPEPGHMAERQNSISRKPRSRQWVANGQRRDHRAKVILSSGNRQFFVTLRIIWHAILRAIWHNRALRGSASDELASVGSLHS